LSQLGDSDIKWEEWTKIASDESVWQDNEEKGLLKAEYVQDYVLRLWFEEDADKQHPANISMYELDFSPLIVEQDPGQAFLPLRDKERFRFVEGNYALVWPNPETGAFDEKSIDMAPECVRFFCENYGKKLKPLELARLKVQLREA